MVKGTVSISIEDFQALLDAKLTADERIEKTNLAAKELQVFLSYLCSRVDIEPFIEQFNNQSRTSTITTEGGRARIEFKDEQKKR
tara:strand:- start:215 stop:469 length:255 start_codon:yes stop_codon:yes gene_type:complete